MSEIVIAWLGVGVYAVVGVIVMRIAFVMGIKNGWDRDDLVGEALFAGMLWPIALVIMVCWWIGKFIFAPTKAEKEREARKLAERERWDTIDRLLRLEPELVSEDDVAFHKERKYDYGR